MRNEPAILLVTCCLEGSRLELARAVIDNIRSSCPSTWLDQITVFDNASTCLEPAELSGFSRIVRANRNVGYWTAVDWWLRSLADDPPRYTYVIESDMIHYGADRMNECTAFLDRWPDLGAVRLHEYSVSEHRLYDKDNPTEGSHRNLWQSHTNRVTGQRVSHQHVEGSFWSTNFLTQLPALNRYSAMARCFASLRNVEQFQEPDFQALYHALYPRIGILDGGIFNCDLNPYGTPDVVTGSWTDTTTLRRLGYHGTRRASIVSPDQYTVLDVT